MSHSVWKFSIVIAIIIPLFIIVQSKPNYRIIHEMAELVDYNRSYATEVECSFGRYNRTHAGISASFNLIRDIADRQVMFIFFVDKMYGTEFKRTGTKLRINLCKFMQTNTFGVPEQLKLHSNFGDACHIPKQHYWVKNFAPDEDKFPPILPFGSYRCEVGIYYKDDMLMRLNWYAKVEQLVKGG